MNSRSREKRSHESSESNRSFVKRMSGLFPSTIKNWFSSPSSSDANGSAKHADTTDSSIEEEGAESAVTCQPSPKRMRLSPSLSNRILPTTTCSSTNTDVNDFTQTSILAFPNKTSILKRDFMSTSTNPKPEDLMISSETETRVSYVLKNSLSSGDTSIIKTRKSLYDSLKNDTPNKKEDKSSSERDMQDSSHCNKSSLLGSTFYAGRTTYGGARSSTSSLKKPIMKTNKKTVLDEKYRNKSLNVSTSARRIMDLLENYSSPLKEARRMSQYLKPEESLKTSDSKPDDRKVVSYKTQELHVPSLATVLSIKRRSRLMDTTSAARQLMASHSSVLRASPYPSTSKPSNAEDSSDKFITKMKVSSTVIQDPPPPLNLPSAVLEIDKDNLPKFPFVSAAPSSQIPHTLFQEATNSTSLGNSAENNNEPKNAVISSVAVPAKQLNTSFKNTDYKFSKPGKVFSESIIIKKPPIFSFVSPEKSVDSLKHYNTKNDSVSSIVGQPLSIKTNLTTTETLNWKCNVCLIRNVPDVDKCVCCGGTKPADESKKCSVCKIEICTESSALCSDCEKKKSMTDSSKIPNLSKWNCQDCWANNDGNKDKCACCGGIKPLKKSEDTKQETQTWKCNICLIENKSSEDKCIACSTIKPGSVVVNKEVQEANTLKIVAGPNDTLKKIVQNRGEKWECQFCLVWNDNNKSKCACCESEKPGATKQSEIKFNFGLSSSTTFKFGIDPKINQVSDKDKNTETQSEAKETNNNVLPKSSFTFGIPVSKPDEISLNSHIAKSQEINSSKDSTLPAFSFGICKEIQSKPTISKDSVLPDTIPGKEVELQEKQQEVPSVDSNKTNNPAQQFSSDSKKNLPATTLSETFSFNASESFLNPSISTAVGTTVESVNTIGSSASASSTTMLESNEAQKTIINFTAPSLFQKNESTPSMSVSPLFQKNDGKLPIASSISLFGGHTSPSSPKSAAIPLFQKNESKVHATSTPLFSSETSLITSLPNVFQKNETTTTSQSLTSSAPMFSFGASTQNTASTEKPMFNFSIGSNNKIGTSNIFSNTNSTAAFGGVPINNSNKYSNTNSTSLSNEMATNSSANGITSVGNVLGGNGLSENSFGTNNLSSHSLNTGNTLPLGSSISTNASGIFGIPKDNNPWPATNNPSSSLFSTTTASNITSRPSTFTFGGNMPFDLNSNNNVSTFGNNIQSTPNIFGISSPNATTGPLFSTPLQNTPATSMFGNQQGNNANIPTIGMFGQQTSNPIPSFGTATSTYEASTSQSPAPAFNFSSGQHTGVFGFGQQQRQQQQQQPQGGVYGFGGAAAPQVQFKVGSGPTTSGRRLRKAVRRTTPR